MISLTGSVAFSAIGFVLPRLLPAAARTARNPGRRGGAPPRGSAAVATAAAYHDGRARVVGAVWGVVSEFSG